MCDFPLLLSLVDGQIPHLRTVNILHESSEPGAHRGGSTAAVAEVAAAGYNSHTQYQGELYEIAGFETDPIQSDSHQMLEDSYRKVAEVHHTVVVPQDRLQAAYNHNLAAGVVHQVGPSSTEDEEGDNPAENSHLTLDFWHGSAKI